ncbi:MAG: LLM class flavin-dependent oxidoreductase, partial [Actinomycetota bacterium]|nr:LLM class flavin-dependent oxidoreductase [Actinomycetota bacterium]
IGTGIHQMPGRTPAMAAMSALTIDHLSGGRFRLGVGVSGPQVAEGWHGQTFDDPLGRTREYMEIVRDVLRRKEPVTASGPHYPLPVGKGRALSTNVRPLRTDLPIYLAAMGPRNVALAAEIADGWLSLFFSPEHVDAFELPALPDGFDVAPMVRVAIDDDIAAARDALRPTVAMYVGSYGSRGANFYGDLVVRFGFGDAAHAIQDAALEGRRDDAIAAVPDALIDAVALVGPREAVRDRLAAFADAGVTTLLAHTNDATTIRALAEAAS